MEILSKEIQEFIEQIKVLDAIGCITIPLADRERLIAVMNKADIIIGPDVQPGRVTYYLAEPNKALPSPVKPAILIVSEEDYGNDEKFAEQIREEAAYFLNVTG